MEDSASNVGELTVKGGLNMTAEQLEQMLLDQDGEDHVVEAVRGINTDLEAKYAELERRLNELGLNDPEPGEKNYFDSI